MSEIIVGDSFQYVKSLEPGSVQLVVSSPPYNIGKEYEEFQELGVYTENMHSLVFELHDAVKEGGSVCWQVGNYVSDGSILPLDYLYHSIFSAAGFTLRNRIVWRFGHGLHCTKRFSGRYEMILWYTKGDEYVFNLDPVRVPQKYPGKKYYKGPKKGQLSCNPLGSNPSDVWEFLEKEWDSAVWDIPNVKSKHPEKVDHPCQFPVELVERCVLALSEAGDTVFDPFGGVGTVAVAAELHGRNGVCVERDQGYASIASQRLEDLRRGTLGIRPMGRPIFDPKASKVEADKLRTRE
jgi:DNA modification methylase